MIESKTESAYDQLHPYWKAQYRAIQELSSQEGWFISEAVGSETGPWQIQKDDENGKWTSDTDVMKYIMQRAALGSPKHQLVLKFMSEQAHPEEIKLLLTCYNV